MWSFCRLVSILTGLCLTAAACGTVPERNPLPPSEAQFANVPGLPEDARFWGDEAPEIILKRLRTWSIEDIQAFLPSWFATEHHYLALSGGGQDGAFGAGLLNGWTASGTRPEFLLVTGISTGALIAPFAFLGPDYDDELAEVYTTLSTDDLLEKRPWTVVATGDAALDTEKLPRGHRGATSTTTCCCVWQTPIARDDVCSSAPQTWTPGAR